MDFLPEDDKTPGVVLITGENGTGKSIILDAIRGCFSGELAKWCKLERDIQRKASRETASVKMALAMESGLLSIDSRGFKHRQVLTTPADIALIPSEVRDYGKPPPNWIIDFWAPSYGQGSYAIDTLKTPHHESFLINSLSGTRQKSDITQLICHFDYLRDSRDPVERETGEKLYGILEAIIEKSLLDGGRLSHVSRARYEPMVVQNGQTVGLENLSGGNAYLIQNLVGLLGKMYSVHFLRQSPLSELGQTPGVLLIDEAENQLHPKWQKRLIRTILEIFPNLQIIATTHSPFIISSVSNGRFFVCKAKTDHCVIEDETATYSNKPVDEILISPLFEETQPFNEEMTRLLNARKQAIQQGDEKRREAIENQLKAMNPEYFSYFDTDKIIESLMEV